MLMSVVFPVTSLLSLPVQAWAQTVPSPAFSAPRPIPAPVVHDDPAWHTIDYHAQEHAADLTPAQATKATVRGPRPTLLDEVGRLTSPVDAAKVAAWKQALHQPKQLPASEAARLHVLVGEVALARDENPEQALWHFAQARKLSHPKQAVYGLACYDSAIASFYEGAYSAAKDAFRHILTSKPGLSGIDRAACALFMRHAGACAGYHDERARIGIPEPPKLDPLCGASAIAQALKTYGKPYDKQTLLKNMRVTGRGSSIQDVVDGARKLGLSPRIVTTDDAGLIALPKPLVAYVEHDHFVSVLSAGKKGVSYLCADCGAWPGGRINLTWQQWHKLEATHYVVTPDPKSDAAQALAWLEDGQSGKAAGVQLASTRPAAAIRAAAPVTGLLRTLKRHVRVVCGQGQEWPQSPRAQIYCGFGFGSLHCDCFLCCALDMFAAPFGASFGDPVNLATGEEEYKPGTDLTVYNPVGPSVSWTRIYNSLRGYDTPNGYQNSDLGQGWSHSYNISVTSNQLGMQGGLPNARTGGANPNATGGGNGLSGYILEPNGARIAYSAPAPPTASNPRVALSLANGAPFLLECDYNSATGGLYFIITQPDRTKLITQGAVPNTSCSMAWYPLGQIADRNGNAITFNYVRPQTSNYPVLSSIADKNNQALLTFNRTANGNLISIADRYNRSVYYHVGTYATQNVPAGANVPSQQELDHVSQVVVTGAASPPDRYVYGYQNTGNGENNETVPALHTITVPSPTGTGTATATINYENSTGGVSSLVDANGNSRSYQQTDANHTQVTIRDPQNNIVYRYTAGYDMNMSGTTKTNGATDANGNNTQVISSETFADPNDPYRPSQTQDGNGYAANGANNKGTWDYTWDQYGNCTTSVTPRNVTTTNTYSYANFALGELTRTQTGAKQATTYAYFEPSGNVHTTTSPLPGTVGGNQSVTTSYTYSTLGNMLTAATPGNGTVASMTTTYGYTQDGNYSQSESLGQALTVTDNLGKITHVRYDSQGRASTSTDPNGIAYNYAYNITGQVTQTQRPATGDTGSGNSVVQNTYLYPAGPIMQDSLYDEGGNLVRGETAVYGPEGEHLSTTGSVNPATAQFDALYRIVKQTDGNNHAITQSYNASGYAATMTLANGETVQATAYDANGNATSVTNGRGIVNSLVYNDPESRLTDAQYPSAPGMNIHLSYDAYGRVSSTTDNTGSKAVTFDDGDHTTAISTTYVNAAGTGNLPTLNVTHSYNADGSVQSIGTPAGSYSYGYDGRGLITSLSNPAGEAFSWNYLDNGWMWKQQSSNALTATYTYNALGWMTELANTQNNANHTLLADYNTLRHDSVGNHVGMVSNLPAAPTYSGASSFQYDNFNQITQETSARAGGYTNAYGYDSAANATTMRGVSHTFNGANERTDGGVTYDGAGNPSAWNGNALTFNVNNQLSAIGGMTAGYDCFGLRVWKQNANGRTYFLYGEGETIPYCEIDGNGNVTAYNTCSDEGLLARHTNGTGGGSVFYSFDPQGGTSQRVDTNGNVLSSTMSDAFGMTATNATVADPYNGFGAQWGYYKDSETGLSLLGARYYDAASGRFLNRDPAFDGLNWYAYASNNPLAKDDPTGLFNLPCIVGGFGQMFGGGMTMAGGVGTIWINSPFSPGIGMVITDPRGAISNTFGGLSNIGSGMSAIGSGLSTLGGCGGGTPTTPASPGGGNNGGGGNTYNDNRTYIDCRKTYIFNFPPLYPPNPPVVYVPVPVPVPVPGLGSGGGGSQQGGRGHCHDQRPRGRHHR